MWGFNEKIHFSSSSLFRIGALENNNNNNTFTHCRHHRTEYMYYKIYAMVCCSNKIYCVFRTLFSVISWWHILATQMPRPTVNSISFFTCECTKRKYCILLRLSPLIHTNTTNDQQNVEDIKIVERMKKKISSISKTESALAKSKECRAEP